MKTKTSSLKTFESSKQRNRMNAVEYLALKVKETDKSSSQSVCVCACARARACVRHRSDIRAKQLYHWLL